MYEPSLSTTYTIDGHRDALGTVNILKITTDRTGPIDGTRIGVWIEASRSVDR